LTLLLEYLFQQADTNKSSREWPVDLLLDVGVPLDSVLAVLENLSFNDGAEWSTSRRRVIAALTVYVCQKWLAETTIAGGLPFGGEEGAQAVLEILRGLSDLRILSGRDGDALRDLIESVQRTI
jgi:nuclear pore complex protein Nup155